jgi:hypothetical protein
LPLVARRIDNRTIEHIQQRPIAIAIYSDTFHHNLLDLLDHLIISIHHGPDYFYPFSTDAGTGTGGSTRFTPYLGHTSG